MKGIRRRGRWLLPIALLALSLVLFAAAFAADFAVKQRWFGECVDAGVVREGDSAAQDGSACVITDRSATSVVERRVHLPEVAALYREAIVALVLSVCSSVGALTVAVRRRRPRARRGRQVERGDDHSAAGCARSPTDDILRT